MDLIPRLGGYGGRRNQMTNPITSYGTYAATPELPLYRATDDSGESIRFRATDDDAARARTRRWMEGADFDTSNGTVYYSADIYRLTTDVEMYGLEDVDCDESIQDEEYVGREDMSFDPPEPDCVGDEDHDWQSPHSLLGGIKENPGVWGHGGGVIIRQCCAHCGRYQVTDTWAQNSSTGKQGLTSVTYKDADEASLTWAARRKIEAWLDSQPAVHGYDQMDDGYSVTLTDAAIRAGEFNLDDDGERDAAWDAAGDALKALERDVPDLPGGAPVFELDDDEMDVVRITI
jgi:hypothetical protein